MCSSAPTTFLSLLCVVEKSLHENANECEDLFLCALELFLLLLLSVSVWEENSLGLSRNKLNFQISPFLVVALQWAMEQSLHRSTRWKCPQRFRRNDNSTQHKTPSSHKLQIITSRERNAAAWIRMAKSRLDCQCFRSGDIVLRDSLLLVLDSKVIQWHFDKAYMYKREETSREEEQQARVYLQRTRWWKQYLKNSEHALFVPFDGFDVRLIDIVIINNGNNLLILLDAFARFFSLLPHDIVNDSTLLCSIIANKLFQIFMFKIHPLSPSSLLKSGGGTRTQFIFVDFYNKLHI